MNFADNNKIDLMIKKWIKGDTSVENSLFNELYPTLRKIVHREHQKINIQEMNTTLLVNEAYLKLKQNKKLVINDKNHLLALSARIIRYILVDTIKKNTSLKRGRSFQIITFQETNEKSNIDEIDIDIDFISLHRLLIDLEKVDEDATRIIELRYFAGLNIEETAKVMNTSSAQISRNWKFAKTWLLNKLNETAYSHKT